MDDLNQDKLAGGRVDFLGLLEEVSNCLNYIMTFWEFGCLCQILELILTTISRSPLKMSKNVLSPWQHISLCTLSYTTMEFQHVYYFYN